MTGKIEYEDITQVAVQKVREANGKLDIVEFKWERGIYTENTLATQMNDFAVVPPKVTEPENKVAGNYW